LDEDNSNNDFTAGDDRPITQTRGADTGSIAPRPATFGICKPTPSLLAQLPECYGGNGYVEEGLLAAPVKRCTMRHCDRTDSTIVIFA